MNDWLASLKIGLIVFVVLAAIGVPVYWILCRKSKRFREAAQSPNQSSSDNDVKKQLKHMAVSKAIEYGIFPLLGMIWKLRKAPEGTVQHTTWVLALYFVIALVLWIIVNWISRRINGSSVVVPSVEQQS